MHQLQSQQHNILTNELFEVRTPCVQHKDALGHSVWQYSPYGVHLCHHLITSTFLPKWNLHPLNTTSPSRSHIPFPSELIIFQSSSICLGHMQGIGLTHLFQWPIIYKLPPMVEDNFKLWVVHLLIINTTYTPTNTLKWGTTTITPSLSHKQWTTKFIKQLHTQPH